MTDPTPMIIAALSEAQRAKLPSEWFAAGCSVCKKPLVTRARGRKKNCCPSACRIADPRKPLHTIRVYTGPSLALPSELHSLLLVCDVVFYERELKSRQRPGDERISFAAAKTWIPDKSYRASGVTDSAALLSAVCAALNIEEIG